MKALISVLIVAIVGFVGFRLFDHWEKVKERRVLEERAARGKTIKPEELQGLPWQLNQKYQEVQADPKKLGPFIESIRKVQGVHDPRLAWIELDYVVLVSATDPVEAKRVFQAVKKRTPTDSPIYPRIRSLGKNYE
jgi:hypothetical protein